MNAPASNARRLAILVSHPTQYYSPWFRWLATHTPSVDIRVFYLWDFGVTTQRDRNFQTSLQWDVDLLSGYKHEFVPNIATNPGTHHFQGLRNPTLVARLAAWKPEALLMFGYKWRSHLQALWWARRHRVPVLFRGDSHILGRGKPTGLKGAALRLLYAQFHAVLHVGAANRDYFTALRLAPEKLFFAPHAVNDALFDPTQLAHQARAAQLRRDLGLSPAARLVLFAGKFIPAKQPRELLAAFLAAKVHNSVLLFVGDGPEKSALHELARTAPPGTVHFLPFANQSEMPGCLLAADVFALPSRGHYETWGLAVNEAMHMGVPCLVSDLVGCQRDLVMPNETGWVFHSGEPNDLTSTLRAALELPLDQLRALGRNARIHVARYTYPQTTAGLLAALEQVSG